MTLWKVGLTMIIVSMLTTAAVLAATPPTTPAKTASVFLSPSLVEKAKANAAKYPWAADIQKRIVANAEPWMKMSDDELWNLMFGATIPRSWMVWSDGYCPACKQNVPMYNWKVDAFAHPWKVECPNCHELFPKNDFKAYYDSGLDEHGIFDPKLADRRLLFNAEHPDPKDPLHTFGVDDGWGYIDGDKKWRFIGAYLVRGPWKQQVVAGIARLSDAYAVTGDKAYAHKAGILLDRVADVFPTFDYMSQGWVYEKQDANGYVSVWHDSCGELDDVVMGYDEVFDGIKNDPELVRFLAIKAKRYKLDNAKSSFVDIQRNIEDRILRDTLANRKKTESNVPHTDILVARIKAVLGWPGNRDEVNQVLDKCISYATAVDGLVGEKGMVCYAATGPYTMGPLLALYSRVTPGFLQDQYKRCPRLLDGYRFYFDTWCLQQYYPNIGDSTTMTGQRGYYGIGFSKDCGINPSMFSFFWDLYKLSGDPRYVQAIYLANGSSVAGLPYSIFADNPAQFQKDVQGVIDKVGTSVKVGCVDKQQWHLSILRSGEDENQRAVWLDYDSGGEHCHADGMNLGVYAKGLDLMSDFGYVPVQFGGWNSPRANWFKMTASHNTVVVDGAWQKPVSGKTTLWGDGKQFRVMRASAPELGGKQYERTAVLVDTSATDFYVLDIFRVVGGSDHAKMQHSQEATLATSGLLLSPGQDYGHGSIFRNTKTDASPKPGWSADFTISDRRGRGEKDPDVHLRITDLTPGAEVSTCEAWVSLGFSGHDEVWIPETITRRRGAAPLASTFISVMEPYDKASNITGIRRLPLESTKGAAYPEANVAFEVTLTDGRRDVIIAADAENPLGLTPSLKTDGSLIQKETGITLDGQMCQVRFSKSGKVEHVALCKGTSVTVAGCKYEMPKGADFVEMTQ